MRELWAVTRDAKCGVLAVSVLTAQFSCRGGCIVTAPLTPMLRRAVGCTRKPQKGKKAL